MKRVMEDGLVKATHDGLGSLFDVIYIDTLIAIAYFKSKIKGGSKPQVIDYLERTVFRKITSDLVKNELVKVLSRDFNYTLNEFEWNEFLKSLKLRNVGNPLNLTPSSSDEYDDAHLKTAKTFNKCIIVTGDKKFIAKDPTAVWFYGKLRQVHSSS